MIELNNAHRHDQFFNLSPDMMCKNDLAGNFLLVNPAFKTLLGYDECDLVGQPYTLIVHPEDEPIMAASLEQVLRAGQVKHVSARLFDAKGKTVWVEISAALGGDRIYVVARDVTEQKRLHQQVSDSAERLITTLQSITDAFFTLDTEWRFTFLNKEAERTLQQPASQLLGRSIWESFTEAVGSQFETEYRRAMDEAIPVTFEAYYSGLNLWVDVRVYPSPEGLAVYFQDVTKRKFADRHMRILERSVEASVNGILITDALQPDMPIVYVNSAFERITGYQRQDVLGRNCRFLQGQQTEPEARTALREGLAAQRDTHVVIRNYRRDGSTFWNELYISPVRDGNGDVSHFIGVQNDISSQREYQAKLAYNASHDVLSGLPNRALLEDRLTQSWQVAKRHKRPLAVLLIDLDAFKSINDTLGHDVGDGVLVEVARRLERQVRPGDTVARFEGDEFVIVLPDLTSQEDVIPVVERILSSVAASYQIMGNALRITASIGIALLDSRGDSPMQLIRQADLAVNKAKKIGRNTYQWFTEDLNYLVSMRVGLRNDLEQALEEGQFELHYQPQIHVPSGQIVCVEALLRWHHPERGNVPPSEFIHLAEETGQIIAISQWVLTQACRDNVALNAMSTLPIIISVNVSPIQFQREDFVPTVFQILESANMSPTLLELELTEGILMDHSDIAITKLELLRRQGIQIAIDDFGTGYSSMSYLKHLPVNKVKIDQSFIRDLTTDYRDAAIVEGIVSMSHKLGLKVVAEGVETLAQQECLRNQQVHLLQGYYLARPMPLKAMKVFLTSQHAQLTAEA